MSKAINYEKHADGDGFFKESKTTCSVCGGEMNRNDGNLCMRCEDRFYDGADAAYEMRMELEYERLERMDPDFVSFD